MKPLSSPFKLIKTAFEIFFEKSNFNYFARIYVWLIPFQLFFIYQNYFISQQSQAAGSAAAYQVISQYPLFLAVVVIVNLLFMVASFWVDLAGVKAVSGVVNRNSLALKELFNFAKKRLWLFALLSLVTGLLQGLGIILLVIPGVILIVWFAFVKFIFVERETGVRDSLIASRELVKGRFWKVFGRILVFALFALLFQTFFALVPYGVGPVFAQLFSALLIIPHYLLYKELSAK
jgi:hypothetical protein